MIENSELVITGEDPEDGLDEGEKPIRLLSNFSIFDPKHRNEFVSLASIEDDDGVDRQFEGAGMVMPYFVNEEDEGQDEETETEPQYVRLGAILRYTVDYTQESEYATFFSHYVTEVFSDHLKSKDLSTSKRNTPGIFSNDHLRNICHIIGTSTPRAVSRNW